MLNTLRGSISGWTAKILLGLLVLSFAVWGIGDVFRGSVANAVLTAGETEVSLQDYALAYNRAESRLASQIGRQPTAEEAEMFGISQSVISQLVAGAVLDEQGRRIDLGLSQDRLAQVIAEDPTFQDASGNFSRAQFQNALYNARISETDYIRGQENQAVRSQIVDAVSEGIVIPDAFATALGLYNGERRTVEYMTLTPAVIPSVADPSEEVLASYFAENTQRYAAPEYRSVSFAVLTPEALADPSTITDEAVAEDYEQYKDRYTTPEQRRVQQIAFPDEAAATEAKAKLDGGASFEDVARDAGRSPADIDLGLVSRAQIPDATVADAAFGLAEGETSDVVNGAFGPVLLRVAEIQPGAVQPLEEVSDEIRSALALVAANDTANSAYNAFEDARAGGATFAEAAQSAGVTVQTIPAVDREGNGPDGQPVPEQPSAQEFLPGVFETEPGMDNVPINFQSNGYVFYDVISIDPARDRTLDEVRDRVIADWKAAETDRLLAERAAQMKSELEAGQSIAEVAAAAGVEARTAASISRQSGASELGQAGVNAAFSGGPGTVATAAGREAGSQVVLRVSEVAPPADPASSVAANERSQMTGMLENDVLESYVSLLQNDTPIAVHPAGIERAKALIR
ncbi:peptidyl-prolyl cis-trans isomerase [Aurantimonas sp. A2-1-M11]|uniref:peptidyl-prolyl cis-trans isomerase n=1 Tax=Aurantimonas sp. A2-1-M11 TaxID=3113712 RepID=UPI002F933098